MEEFDAKFFLEELNQQGLPWEMIELVSYIED
jgi:saccharopine dehydrogenase-like NADP-dependent oxidoreductase